MKILVLNWQDIKNPLGGGAEVHLHEIFKRIAARGHQVTLFCSSFDGAPAEETVDGIRVLRQGGRNVFNFVVPNRYSTQFRRERYDVVVDDINKIPFYSPLFVREPVVGIVHHFFGKTIFLETSFIPALYVYSAEWLAHRLYRNVPLAVVSESTRQELLEKGFHPENLDLVPNSVDHTLFHPIPSIKRGASTVGHLGRLKKYKSVDHLLRAFVIVHAEMPESRLLIVGDGDFRPRLEALAAELNLSSSVRFAGHVSSEEKVRLLNGMTVAVNCSAKEGWGLTVIEANACGVPVVASDVPGLRDAVKDEETGLLYEYGNIEQLAQKILLILRDEHLRQRLSAQAIEWAQSFNWDDSASRMLQLLQRTAEQAGGRRARAERRAVTE